MRGGSGVMGVGYRRLRISSSCPLGGYVFIRYLVVADSCALIEISFSFFMLSCEKSL